MLGSPIAHSLSPVLHRAAYAALGLTDWAYDRAEVDAPGFADHLAQLADPAWRGLSLTAPLKEVALQAAAEVSTVARATGAVNTLVRRADGGWDGHNTDVDGVAHALREAGVAGVEHAVVVGSGATARSAVAALAQMGASDVHLMVRHRPRPETMAQARAAGVGAEVLPMGSWPHRLDVVISTVPREATDSLLPTLPVAGPPGSGVVTFLDAVYGQGPGALGASAPALGYAVVPGTEMLLHQGAEQVRLMTGLEPPVPAMRAALEHALQDRAASPAGTSERDEP